MFLTTLIGFSGALLVLIGFFLNEIHVVDADSVLYDALNFLGASLLVAYAVLIVSWPFAVLNGVWAFVALCDIIKDLQHP